MGDFCSIWRARSDWLSSSLAAVLWSLPERVGPPSGAEIHAAATLENLTAITTERTLFGRDVSAAPVAAVGALRHYLETLPHFEPGLTPLSASWPDYEIQHEYVRMHLRHAAVEAVR